MKLINCNKMITFNETAAFLWEQAESQSQQDGYFTAEALCDALRAEYEIGEEQACADVNATIQSWLEAGVTEA